MNVGRRIYFDKLTGNVALDTGERSGSVMPTTVEQDILTYKVLSTRNIDTFDNIELEFGQHSQDFMECTGYRVNPTTKTIEFSYPDPTAPEPQDPVYQAPLSEEVEELKRKLDLQDTTMEELMFTIIPDLTGGGM